MKENFSSRSQKLRLKTILQVSAVSVLATILWISAGQFFRMGKQSKQTERKQSSVAESRREVPADLRKVPASFSTAAGKLIHRLPQSPPMIVSHFQAKDYKDQLEINRKLGALEGEAALDFILANSQNDQATAIGMAAAIAGWMEVDYEAAIAAFIKMNQRHDGGALARVHGAVQFPMNLFEWKGRSFHNGLA